MSTPPGGKAAKKASKKPMSNKKYLGIWVPIIAILTVLLVVANAALIMAGGWVSSQFGTGTYTFTNSEKTKSWDLDFYKADYADEEEVTNAARDLVAEIGSEGMVLAKNTQGALPLSKGAKVTMLGRAAADPVYGGSGSGSISVTEAITPRQALEDAGFSINTTAFDAIATFAKDNKRGFIEMDKPEKSTYNIGEMPISSYEALSSSFSGFNDAALVFIGRPGGEGGDLNQNMEGWDDNYQPGQHQLELNQDERALIDLATKNFKKTIVIVNASTTLELGDVQDNPGVAGIILAGSPGLTGWAGLAGILSGDVNPSGRTVDTWVRDFTKDPTFVNFGDFKYSNLSVEYPVKAVEKATSNAVLTNDATFTNYAEGIYMGYRYYETAAKEGFINYEDAVVYPFGYGLSYTDFTWSVAEPKIDIASGDISVDVTVANNGTQAGKDVVELYYSAPYTKGGIEKADQVLVGFAKTGLIEPGASETVTISLNAEDMASYDYKNAKAYVLEAGDYILTLRTDSHTVAEGVEPITYNVPETITYKGESHRKSDKAEVTNEFDDVSAHFTDDASDAAKVVNLSRADFAGTFPTAPSQEQLKADKATEEAFQPYDAEAAAKEFDGKMPATNEKVEYSLVQMRGLPKDDPKWDTLLNSLSVDDMATMQLNGAYQTPALPTIQKPTTIEPDGPAGFSSFINADINGVAYPSEYLLAQTWSEELLHKMGTMLGNEALFKHINGWYAPAANLHRSPFAGRNFEYYSEDPFLSGKMLTAVSNGIGEKGVYTMLKHFALNEQETNRVNNGVASWANEQAIRELYLKPFEMGVKDIKITVPYISDDEGTRSEAEVGALGIMSSFNRIGATWTGGSKPLMTNVLRGEWGFEGFAITDFNLYPYMNPNQGIAAGTDVTLTFAPSKSYDDTSSAKAVTDIRNATHNILFTVANSNAMIGMAPGADVDYTPPTWVYIQIGASIAVGVLIAGLLFMVVRRVLKHRNK